MANNQTAISQIQPKTYADGTDQLLGWSLVSNADVIIPVANLYANVSLSTPTLLLSNTVTPSNSTITVAKGTMWFDANYLYLAVSNNVLKRVAISPF